MASNKYSRKLRPRRAFISHKNGDPTPIELNDALQDIQQLITHIHDIVQQELSTNLYPTHQALTELDWQRGHEAQQANKKKPELKPAEEARQAGLHYKDKIHPDITQKYRVEQLIAERIVSALKKWDGLYQHRPNAGHVIHLGTISTQMASLTFDKESNSVWLAFTPWGRTLLIEFNLPKNLPAYTKICKPSISLDPITGKLTWNFCFETAPQRSAISQEYNLGIDRGKIEMGTWSVNHIPTGKPVLEGFLSDEVRHILGKIKRLEQECYHINRKRERMLTRSDLDSYLKLSEQLSGKRARITELKENAAKQAARECVAISGGFDNCIITVEELDWAGNWHGKFPLGRFLYWLNHFAERVGTHVQKVNAAYTSQDCSECGARDYYFDGREHVCRNCAVLLDRDINAARNIAVRGAESARKSGVTRERSKNTVVRPCLTRSHWMTVTVDEAGLGAVRYHRVSSGFPLDEEGGDDFECVVHSQRVYRLRV